MLLARKCVIYDPDSETILKHMSYSAAKLWNVGNYEKRNYRLLGLEKFPDWYDQKNGLNRISFTKIFHRRQPRMSCRNSRKHGKVFSSCVKQAAWKTHGRQDLRKTGWTLRSCRQESSRRTA